MNLSARNKLTGKVVSVDEGAVNAIVKLQIAEDMIITSTITIEAVKELGLVEGKEATAIVKVTFCSYTHLSHMEGVNLGSNMDVAPINNGSNTNRSASE